MRTSDVLNGYIECALWSSIDYEGNPLDDTFDRDDLSQQALDTMAGEVADFLRWCEQEGLDLSEIDPEQVGHDFWLTRNGHGAGFWDRGLGDLGDRLTKMCKPYGMSDLYIGDDGALYVT